LPARKPARSPVVRGVSRDPNLRVTMFLLKE
jgi:hypothetical protein